MKKKRIFCFLIAMICSSILMSSSISASQNTVYSWYCKRNKDHKQPVADSNMQWIEKYNGYYIDHLHGDDAADKVVYLTFDAGYENGNVEKILTVMREENVRGAFFILGHLITSCPDLVRQMAEDGHTVCNHTNRHKDMTQVSDFDAFQKELKSLEMLYRDTVGGEMAHYYRPPEGKFDERSMDYANRLGYKTIFWSLAYADWDNNNQPDEAVAKKKILDHVHNGAVILLHPTSATNANILGDLIRELKGMGYRFGTLDELVAGQG